jgi:hypothetical protein
MADGKVKIEVDAEEKDAARKLDDLGEAADDAAKDVDDLGDKARKTGEELEDLGDKSEKSGDGLGLLDVAAGNLVAGGISSLIGGIGDAISSLANLAEETREYREDMAKLETAFKDGGHSAEDAQKVYDDFYKLLGESDRTVEAVNHLAEFTDNTEELSEWATIAAGVTAKFGDSLPIEGLTEAANETAKVGAVTGPLADALNWAGISEEKFNEELAKCNSEQQRASLITKTLSGEYSEAAAEYNTLTASTQEARAATNEMEKAQARLGAVIEPVTTWFTNAGASLLNFVAGLAEDYIEASIRAEEQTRHLTREQIAFIEQVHKAAGAFREMKAASDEAAIGITEQYNYVTSLADELFRLADANGYVEETDRARAEFILGELSEATGKEYEMSGNLIQNYGNLKQSIYDVIEAKKAELLLAEYQDDYVAAIKQQADAEQARVDQAIALADKERELEEARLNFKEISAGKEAYFAEHLTQTERREYLTRENNARMAVTNLEKELEKERIAYAVTEGAVQQSNIAIMAHEEAKRLALEGNYTESIKLLNDYGSGFLEQAGKVDKGSKEEIALLEEKVKETSINLGLLEAEYEETYDSLPDYQKRAMDKALEDARKQAQDARAEWKRVGGDQVEGLVEGAKDKNGNPTWNLAGTMKSFVEDAIAAVRKTTKTASPSKVFKWYGEMMSEGLAVGAEHGGKKAVEAVRKVGADMVKEGQKTAEKRLKDVEKEIEKISDLRDAANKKLSNLDRKKNAQQYNQIKKELENYDAKKKLLQKELTDARERERAMQTFASKYENHLSDLKRLEDDYAKDHQSILDRLDADSKRAVEDYNKTFESRVQAIRGSLGIFDIVENKEKASGSEMTKALKSQVTELERYNEALSALFGRDVISSEFYEEFAGLGVSYLPQLEAINKMTDEQLAEYVSLWEEKTRLASEAATKELAGERGRLDAELLQLRADAVKEADELTAEYNGKMLELLGEITSGMLNAGNAGIEALGETVSGYVETGAALMEGVAEGMESKQAEIIQQAVSAVRKAISAAKAEAGIHSPSKVAKDEIGANLALGVAEGWHDKLSTLGRSIQADMSGITDRLRATVSAENARYGRSHGTPDSGFTELARAVNVQTAGINSLASAQRGGAMRKIVLQVGKRELGSVVVDVANTETARVGVGIG